MDVKRWCEDSGVDSVSSENVIPALVIIDTDRTTALKNIIRLSHVG